MELEESKNYQQQLIEQVENAQSDKYIEKCEEIFWTSIP